MRVKKRVQGLWIDLDYELIKKYPRYNRYQVYKIAGDNRIPLYTECWSEWRLKELVKKGYIINEEPTEEVELCML
jgi:hypothetical protein